MAKGGIQHILFSIKGMGSASDRREKHPARKKSRGVRGKVTTGHKSRCLGKKLGATAEQQSETSHGPKGRNGNGNRQKT